MLDSIGQGLTHNQTILAIVNVVALVTGIVLLFTSIRAAARFAKAAYQTSVKGFARAVKRAIVRQSFFFTEQPSSYLAFTAMMLGSMMVALCALSFILLYPQPKVNTSSPFANSFINHFTDAMSVGYIVLLLVTFVFLLLTSRVVMHIGRNRYIAEHQFRNSPKWLARRIRNSRNERPKRR